MQIILALLSIAFLLYVEVTMVVPRATGVELFLLVLVNGVIIRTTLGHFRKH